MKTIALSEKTFELIKELKERERESSFDKIIINLIHEKEKIDPSLFGSLKGKTKSFTSKERREIWKDKQRESL